MNLNTGVGNKVIRKKSKKKLVITVVAILLIAATGIVAYNYFNSKKANGNVGQLSTAKVQKGDLTIVISGSAPISSSTKYDFTSNVSGTLTNIYFKDGDKVKAGDPVFEIDDKDTQLQIKQLKNSIAQTQLSHENNLNDLKSSTVIAPIDGEITDIQPKEGDTLSNNGTLLTITDKSKLKLLVPFNNTYRSKLTIGQEVSVNAFDTATEELNNVKGSISSISSPNYTTSDGSEVYNVGVIIENSSSLTENMVANVVINIDGNELISKDSGSLSYIKSMTVKAESGGKLEKLNVENGRNIKKGDVLAVFNNKDLQLTIETSNLKLEDLYLQLETAEKKLLDYKIYAPFDGTFTLNDIGQGNSIKQGDILGSVANYDTMEFSIDVDELDISKIAVGQPADVTIDALTETTDNPINGTVTKIAVEGSSSNGVSTYPVTIQMEQNSALKGGMNANAEIIVNQKTDVLYVPIDAVQKRNGKSYVTVVSNAGNTASGTSNSKREQSKQATEQTAGQTTERREVTTGISTEDYIEILSGLTEEETVIVTSASNSTNNQSMFRGVGGGMMMGEPPQNNSGKRN